MKKVQFPLELLAPQCGTLSFNDFGASIEIPFATFSLPDHGEITTKIVLDCITLPSENLPSLVGKSFRFPRNPEDGYVDGSIYMGHHHHPVDLLEMHIGPTVGNEVVVRLAVEFAFSFEGLSAGNDCEYDDTAWTFEASLKFAPNSRTH